MRIAIIGEEHMAQSFSYCMERIGHELTSVEDCEVCWIAIDTPIGEDGKGDTQPVYDAIEKIKNKIANGMLVICSSQIPVGSSEHIKEFFGEKVGYAYVPEHMRIGRGIFDFMSLKTVTVGLDNDEYNHVIKEMFWDKQIFFTNIATAEMIKHATNAFLATTVSLINDISDVGEPLGVKIEDVTTALRNDWRIGKEAYLDVSVGFRGGHFDRDLHYLVEVADAFNVETPILSAVIKKNHDRRDNMLKKLVKP